MSNKFSLLLLNNKNFDKHPRTWICISGKNIKEIVSKIEKEIIKRGRTNREQISKQISKNLGCNYNSIKNFLRGSIRFYPIPILLELISLLANKEYYENLLENSIEYLKVNSASSKPIRAVKELSEDLAKIVGAFCADGSLSVQFVIASKDKSKLKKSKDLGKIRKSKSRNEYYIAVQINRDNYNNILKFSRGNKEFQTQAHYTIELTDEYKSNVEAFNSWVFKLFEIKPISFYKRDIAWRTIFSNKILARYLITFFDFLPGYKTDIVSEPKIIKNSEFKIRKEFAKGAIMFDGCVTKRKTISFSTISQNLANSIKDILEKDGIKVGSFLNKREEYSVYTFANENDEKLLEYFEKGTKKAELLKWLNKKDFKSEQITYEKDLKQTNTILDEIRKVGICDSNYLSKQLNYTHTTIRQHLLILKLKGIINLSNRPKILSDFVGNSITVLLKEDFHSKLFKKLELKFIKFENLAKFLNIHKATISAWKVRKNRIPLRIAKEFCVLAEIENKDIFNNIEGTDREIAEII